MRGSRARRSREGSGGRIGVVVVVVEEEEWPWVFQPSHRAETQDPAPRGATIETEKDHRYLDR